MLTRSISPDPAWRMPRASTRKPLLTKFEMYLSAHQPFSLRERKQKRKSEGAPWLFSSRPPVHGAAIAQHAVHLADLLIKCTSSTLEQVAVAQSRKLFTRVRMTLTALGSNQSMWSMTTIFVIEPSASPCRTLTRCLSQTSISCCCAVDLLHDRICVDTERVCKCAAVFTELREAFPGEEQRAGFVCVATQQTLLASSVSLHFARLKPHLMTY